MTGKNYGYREYLIKNGYGEYHLPEWIEVFRRKKRRKDYILRDFDYLMENKYS